MLPAAGAAAAARTRGAWRSQLSAVLAHHPDEARYADDVFHIGGVRVCVGCALTYPTFMAVIAVLTFGPLAFATATLLSAGIGLAAVQGVSSLGRARRRWQKVVVKLAFGTGLALTVHAVLEAAWPSEARALALYVLLALALATAIPRARRMRRARHQAAPA